MRAGDAATTKYAALRRSCRFDRCYQCSERRTVLVKVSDVQRDQNGLRMIRCDCRAFVEKLGQYSRTSQNCDGLAHHR